MPYDNYLYIYLLADKDSIVQKEHPFQKRDIDNLSLARHETKARSDEPKSEQKTIGSWSNNLFYFDLSQYFCIPTQFTHGT